LKTWPVNKQSSNSRRVKGRRNSKRGWEYLHTEASFSKKKLRREKKIADRSYGYGNVETVLRNMSKEEAGASETPFPSRSSDLGTK
jgi:hypothetical protein